MAAVQSLCSRVFWLNDGSISKQGTPGQVVFEYLQASAGGAVSTEQLWDNRNEAPGNDQVRLRRVCVRPQGGSPSDPITMRTPLAMEFEFWNLVPGAYLNLNFHLLTEQQTIAFASAPEPANEPVWYGRPFPVGLFRSECSVPGDLLNAGRYYLRVFVGKDSRYVIFHRENALVFEVHDSAERRGRSYGTIPGAVRPLLKWTTEMVDDVCKS
jgi:lipopolysaccharide transport system ATP-binding protein